MWCENQGQHEIWYKVRDCLLWWVSGPFRLVFEIYSCQLSRFELGNWITMVTSLPYQNPKSILKCKNKENKNKNKQKMPVAAVGNGAGYCI